MTLAKRIHSIGRRGLLALTLIGVAVAVAAAVPSVEPGFQDAKTGTVVDIATRQPIVGAHVVLFWYHRHISRTLLGHGGSGGDRCLMRMEASTDAQGRFSVRATQKDIDMVQNLDPEFEDTYFLGLRTYAPGYYRPDYKLQYSGGYPSVRATVLNGVQVIEPVALTKDDRVVADRAFDTVGVPESLMCMRYPGDVLTFVDEVYHEAYPLVCEQGGGAASAYLAEFRLNAVPVMPALPDAVKAPLEQVVKEFRARHAPLSPDDQTRICRLLKQANETTR